MFKLNNSHKEDVIEFCRKNQYETQFFYSNIHECGIENDGVSRRCGNYYGYYINDEIVGIIGFFNLGSSIIYFSDGIEINEKNKMLEEFKQAFLKEDKKLLLGFKRCTKELFNIISHEVKTLKILEEYYCLNEKFIPFNLEGVSVKKECDFQDDSWAYFKYKSLIFFQHTDGMSVEYLLKNKNPYAHKSLYLLKGEEVVAKASVVVESEKYSQIGGVYTDERFRGNGYCTFLMSELCKLIINSNKIPSLFVIKDNTPAVKAYERIGFTIVDDYETIYFQ